jgi:hypothetical protein
VSAPPTVDFLARLRNDFDSVIVPLLDQKAREAYQKRVPPEEMTDIEGKRIKFAILHTVYGKGM